MAAATRSTAPDILHVEDMHNPETSLIARAEALNAFTAMQTAANKAATRPPPRTPRSPAPYAGGNSPTKPPACFFCFGSTPAPPPARRGGQTGQPARPRREYYPENLSVQPERHPWTPRMEWLILACVDLLESRGLDERNLFAVSAVEDLVRELDVGPGSPLPRATDPHVAAGAIKNQIRHAAEPLVPRDALKGYIEAQAAGPIEGLPYPRTQLALSIGLIAREVSPRRAFIFARFMRLLGRVSANVENSGMNAHCLAKCVAPSMLHWDPNSGFALLMLGKITAYVMNMIDDARRFDETLCQSIASLGRSG